MRAALPAGAPADGAALRPARRSAQADPGFEAPRAEALRYGFAALAAAAIPFVLAIAGAGASWHPTLRASVLLLLFGAGYLALTRREEPARAILARRSRGGSGRA